MRRAIISILIGCLCLYGIGSGAQANAGAGQSSKRPNVLLILADDLGWSDLGCYGGEISTPNLDGLAKNGLAFRQFYNTARCSPSRAAILTGLHPHQAGFPNLSGALPKSAVTLAEVLGPAGYRTYMVGKWHLNAKNPPTERGFEEFYGMLGGFNSCWQEDPYYTRWPKGREKRAYDKDKFYSTDVFADYALDFIAQGQKGGGPWFMYLAFNAPHFPLHAPEADIAKYERMYFEKGWDRIRADRLARQKELGLLPRELALTPRSVVPENWVNVKTGWADKDNPAWESLPEDRRKDLARRMAVFAAMVDREDRAIGRIVDHLKSSGHFDNTLIFFLSDNGACAEWDPFGFDKSSGPTNVLHTGEDLKRVGGPESYVSYGSGWANACNTPWRLYKHYGHEGGVRTPMIVSWPAGMQARGLTDQAGYITDFMPTLCEVTGAKYPAEREGIRVMPPEGVSLVPALRGQTIAKRLIFMEHEGNRSVRDGDWKLVALKAKPWELYDLANDPTEMHDKAAGETARVKEMSAAWDEWADRCNVRPKRSGAGPGSAAQSEAPRVANRALVISCEVETTAKDGVILAHGGREVGYAIWLKDGRPIFTVRTDEKTATDARGADAVSGRFKLVARLEADGKMSLAVDGREVATAKAPGLIPRQPKDELSVGEDTKSAVGAYEAPNRLEGKVRDVSVTSP